MNENKIIAFIGLYGCLILANVSKGDVFPWFWLAAAFLWLCQYTYLTFKQ